MLAKEKSSEAKQNPTSGTKIAVPTTRIGNINIVIRQLFRLKSPATGDDISPTLPEKISISEISHALSTAKKLGLTKSGGKKGLYDLTDDGKEYGRYIDVEKPEEASKILRKLILQNPLWKAVIDFLKATEGNEKEIKDMVVSIERKLGKQWKSSMRSLVGECYGSILSFANLADYRAGKILSKVEAPPPGKIKPPSEGAAPTEITLCPYCGNQEIAVIDETLQSTLQLKGGQKLVIRNTFYCRTCRQNFSRISERIILAKVD